jgi:hypothetical protein
MKYTVYIHNNQYVFFPRTGNISYSTWWIPSTTARGRALPWGPRYIGRDKILKADQTKFVSRRAVYPPQRSPREETDGYKQRTEQGLEEWRGRALDTSHVIKENEKKDMNWQERDDWYKGALQKSKTVNRRRRIKATGTGLYCNWQYTTVLYFMLQGKEKFQRGVCLA